MLSIRKKLFKNRKGFTLIELIVVIAILAILAAIAVPRLLGVRADAELKADRASARAIASAVSVMEADTGTAPATIAALVPDYLDSVPDSVVEETPFAIRYNAAGSLEVIAGAEGSEVVYYPIP